MPVVTTLGLWVVSSLMLESPLALVALLCAMMVYVPAIWAVLGFAIFIIGVMPRLAVLAWGYFIFIFVAGFFGDVLNMPKWALSVSPFHHIPQLPLEEMRVFPLLVLTAVALALAILGIVFYRRRDLHV